MKWMAVIGLLLLCRLLTAQSNDLRQDTTAIDSTQQLPKELQQMLQQLIQDNTTATPAKPSESSLEITGLVLDETRTKAGRDFYELFFNQWNAPATSSEYTIFIEEKPGMGQNTQIEVRINEDVIFQNVLQPRYEVIESMVQYVLGRASDYLANYEDIRKSMESEDQRGSGIF